MSCNLVKTFQLGCGSVLILSDNLIPGEMVTSYTMSYIRRVGLTSGETRLDGQHTPYLYSTRRTPAKVKLSRLHRGSTVK